MEQIGSVYETVMGFTVTRSQGSSIALKSGKGSIPTYINLEAVLNKSPSSRKKFLAALEPVLKQLGDEATPDQMLDLKICDPAMGSGAFLVEACRALGERLEAAWVRHPQLLPDEARSDPPGVCPARGGKALSLRGR